MYSVADHSSRYSNDPNIPHRSSVEQEKWNHLTMPTICGKKLFQKGKLLFSNSPRNKHHHVVSFPICPNSRWKPSSGDPIQTIASTMHGMLRLICADTYNDNRYDIRGKISYFGTNLNKNRWLGRKRLEKRFYPRQLDESMITCGQSVTWWPALSMCIRRSKSADMIGK